MTQEDAFQTVAEVIAMEFKYERHLITAETVAADVPGWDSFSNGVLLMEIEEKLGVSLSLEDIFEAANVGAMAAVISRSCP